jgi:hypothetical protein
VELRRYLQTKLGKNWRGRRGSSSDAALKPVQVLFWGQSVNIDFLALTRAEALIGSISSFSLWAAVLHDSSIAVPQERAEDAAVDATDTAGAEEGAAAVKRRKAVDVEQPVAVSLPERLSPGALVRSPLIFLPVCELFFHKQTVPLPGVRWIEASPIWSRDMASLDVEEVIARLKGLGSDDAAFE